MRGNPPAAEVNLEVLEATDLEWEIIMVFFALFHPLSCCILMSFVKLFRLGALAAVICVLALLSYLENSVFRMIQVLVTRGWSRSY